MPEFKLPMDIQAGELASICQRFGVQELALFGSVLRDDFSEQSDIDVLCTVSPESSARGMGWIHLQLALEALWGRRVDLVEPHLLDKLIRDEILGDKRIIYVAPSGVREDSGASSGR